MIENCGIIKMIFKRERLVSMKENCLQATESLLQFIRKSPTAFHAVESAEALLLSHGFVRLEEAADWKLMSGGKYFVTRNRS